MVEIDEILKAFAEEGKKNKNNIDKHYVEGHGLDEIFNDKDFESREFHSSMTSGVST